MGRVVGISFFLLVATVTAWKLVSALPSERTTVVEDGGLIRVLSWDSARKRLTIVLLPEDVRLEGARGMGLLPLSSIRRFETFDRGKTGVFGESIAEALAVPIVGVFPRVPWTLRVRLWWIMQRLRPDAITTFDAATRGVLRNETLPDGSTVRVFDINRFDAMIGSLLEVDSIRREELRVRVVNTTDIVGLGSRVARFLSRAGMVVVAVDSESEPQETCIAHVKEDLRSAQTVRFIKDLFDCSVSVLDTDERVDITVRIEAKGTPR